VRDFRYVRPTSREDAVSALAEEQSQALGGGTDLMVLVEERVAAPSRVVDLRGIPDFDAIDALPDGGVRMAAGARIADIAAHPLIRARFPALAQACDAVAAPALRNMGTLGGNLCQRPRCWYFRRTIPCLKNGGVGCPAHDGENQYHAIIDGGPCWIVHPSDPAVALLALDAEIEIVGTQGSSTVPISSFYVLPSERLDHETVLRPGEFVTAVTLPTGAAGGRQLYRKLMQRGAWDFALVSIAAARREDGAVRLAMGGVAPRPWRVSESVEEDVASGGLDEDSIAALVERALYDAQPLSKNGYKVELAASLLSDAIRELSA
jgi:xanthine dehydrogenase YagS FAD-binding subunit